jgi:hypothetical protein
MNLWRLFSSIWPTLLVLGLLAACSDSPSETATDAGDTNQTLDATSNSDSATETDSATDADSSTAADSGDGDGDDADVDLGPDVSVEAGISHQVARLGEAFSMAIPEDAFSDQELTYHAEVLRRDMSGDVPEILNDFWWQRDLDNHWLDFEGETFSGTPSTYDDLQTLQIMVTATARNGSEASVAFLLVVVDGEGDLVAPASTEADCKVVLGTGDKGYVDGDELNIEPGDSICIRGGETTGGFSFRNLQGTAARPIYILNVDGRAFSEAVGLSYTIGPYNSNHFKILGAGSPENPYGWAIQGENGPAIQIKGCYRDIEVAYVEVRDTGFAGLSIKNDGEDRPEGDMYDIRAHDIYVHHTGTDGGTQAPWSGEGAYCGLGGWQYGTHSIHRFRLHHVIGHDIAWDALQIKNTDDGDAIVERNFLRRYGIGEASNTGAHDEGLFAGEGSTGIFRYNWIEDAYGSSANGIQFMGAGDTLMHHNVIVNLADDTIGRFPIYGARKGTLENPENLSVRFIHNTFAGFEGQNETTKALVRVFTDFGTQETVNNLFVAVDGDDITGTDGGGNIQADDHTVFSDVGTRDLRPASGSQALDQGVPDDDVTVDILGRTIPQTGITSGAFQVD